jgi:hypothetical protein
MAIEVDETFDPIDVLRYAIDELGHSGVSPSAQFGPSKA